MVSKTVTLSLEGNIPMAEFADAFDGLRKLLESLSREIARDTEIEWLIDYLEAGSATVTVRGESTSADAVEMVTSAYLTVGQAQERGAAIPYSARVRSAAEWITAVLDGQIHTVRFETEEGDATVYSPTAIKSDRKVIGSYGAVTGRIQTLSNRGSLHFTLYDVLRDKAVSCYLEPDSEEMMRGVWGKLAIAEGWVSRDPESGRPLSVRHVRRVTPRPEVAPGSFREARGAIAFPPGSPSGTELIRRQRDEQRSLYG